MIIKIGIIFHKIFQYLPITIRKWVVISLYPFSQPIIKNFCLQSISCWKVSGYKWWISIRSKRKDFQMRELWWCFCFEGFSIETRKIFWWGHSTMYSNLRMTFLLSKVVKTKHNAKRKSITPTTKKIERQFADTCQSAILNLAHLKYILFRM